MPKNCPQPLTPAQRRALVEAPLPTFTISSPKAHGGTFIGEHQIPVEGRRVWPSRPDDDGSTIDYKLLEG